MSLSVAGCGSGSPASVGSQGPTTELSRPKVDFPKGPPPEDFESRELVEGTGATAESGDKVTIRYQGAGYESEKEFDSSWDSDDSFIFTVGTGEVIAGWERGVEGMKVGGRRELILPPEFTYGAPSSPAAESPEETLIYVIDLLAVE
jgi:peptidylprolyl isomerase